MVGMRRSGHEGLFCVTSRKVAYFGIWAEDGRDEQLGDIHVWNILCDTLRRCTTEDMRESQDVKDALEWFARRLTKNALVRDFARALNTHDPMQRYWEAGDALKRLKRGMVR